VERDQLEKEVARYARTGHDSSVIREHFLGLGVPPEDIDQAIRQIQPKKSWHLSLSFHMWVILSFIMLFILVPILWVVYSSGVPDIDDTSTTDKFIGVLEHVIEEKDGEAYLYLMSQQLAGETCTRWKMTGEALGHKGVDCVSDLPGWYAEEMSKVYSEAPDLHSSVRAYDGERVHLEITDRTGMTVTVILIREDLNYRMVTDYILDAGMM
jgi:hypothetical protein